MQSGKIIMQLNKVNWEARISSQDDGEKLNEKQTFCLCCEPGPLV